MRKHLSTLTAVAVTATIASLAVSAPAGAVTDPAPRAADTQSFDVAPGRSNIVPFVFSFSTPVGNVDTVATMNAPLGTTFGTLDSLTTSLWTYKAGTDPYAVGNWSQLPATYHQVKDCVRLDSNTRLQCRLTTTNGGQLTPGSLGFMARIDVPSAYSTDVVDASGSFTDSRLGPIDTSIKSTGAPLTAAVSFDADVTRPATISGTGVDGGSIVVRAAGANVAGPIEVTGGKWSLALPTSIGSGSHDLVVEQTVGAETTTVTTTVDFGAPVKITAPTETDIQSSTLRIAGTGANKAAVVIREGSTPLFQGTVVGASWGTNLAGIAVGTHTYTVEQTAPGGVKTEDHVTVKRTSAVTVTSPADPKLGYIANAPFTFRGTGTPGHVITIQNIQGTVLANNVVVQSNGEWEWLRPNMRTSVYNLDFIQDKGTANTQTASIRGFGPNATPSPVITVTNPADPSVGYVANTSFTFRGKAPRVRRSRSRTARAPS
ncbi:hypothetical protein AX769_02410 [Frondihabitans sp. PAMC 28766]|uniref:hypothetical protein n=1 Tax=Frondihabitans sp. PAMC 28766 TaxID=1795630 RepID=UPI00078E64FD|nr:hypothetical protein [Frondihabitans sp. PAMC 28766]AMM19193.1 hypothetical protein AX769_02410 [Frondihabitans sp. PAMC 28766]